MKIAIIGAGNMGGALVRGLAQSSAVAQTDIAVSNPSSAKLAALKAEYEGITTTNDNRQAVKDAELVVLAVKPWKWPTKSKIRSTIPGRRWSPWPEALSPKK